MKIKIILIVILLIYAAVTLGFSLKAAWPKKAEVESITPKVKVYTPETFQNKVVEQVKTYRQFGLLPVTVDPASQGRDNPFAP